MRCTPQQRQILSILEGAKGAPLTWREIELALFGRADLGGKRNQIKVQISRLRKQGYRIEASHGRGQSGYRLVSA